MLDNQDYFFNIKNNQIIIPNCFIENDIDISDITEKSLLGIMLKENKDFNL